MADWREEPSPVVQRAIDALRELPPVRDEMVTRVVAAAARSRALDTAPNADDLALAEPSSRRRILMGSGIAIAAAILIALVTLQVTRSVQRSGVESVPATPPAALSTASLSRGALEAVPVPTQFVFDGKAHHVALVGDFNNWDDHATPLEQEPGSSLWSVTVPILRGRHIYAFLVDSVWTIDKRAPVARDPDFGVTGSVILVGRP